MTTTIWVHMFINEGNYFLTFEKFGFVERVLKYVKQSNNIYGTRSKPIARMHV